MSTVELGFEAMKRADYQEAINIFKRALDQKREARAFFGLGVANYHLGDRVTARWAFYQALEKQGNYQQAQEYLDRMEKDRITKPLSARLSRFRTGKTYFEILDTTWRSFFVKGINIGLGLPGSFPGEFAIKGETYLKWFKQIAMLGVNAVRVYTVQPPGFYEALYRFNESGARLFLLQGIWIELPQNGDFRNDAYAAGIRDDMRNAVDVLYGNVELPERQGYASGAYVYDVSPFVMGIILGREWESCAVKEFNERYQRKAAAYDGKFLSIAKGNPFEIWVTERCDDIQEYEYDRYGVSHPVSVVNWPTLDPLSHPSESSIEAEYARQGIRLRGPSDCQEPDDEETLDVSGIVAKRGSGFFASYHVYPYFPDFMIYGYPDESDSYQAYLKDLKRHHGHQPVLIAEFGVPSSRDSAHWHPHGWDHGRHTDEEQGNINGQLMRDILEAGMAGGVLFSWFDEWCKKTWLFGEYSIPAERKPFWFNIQDPEQNYGLLAAYPGYPGKKVTLACRRDEWKNATVLYERKERIPAVRFNDGFDDVRKLARLSAQHDEGFLYLHLETGAPLDFNQAHYLIGLDTCLTEAGERQLPFRTNLTCPIGLTFLIQVAGKDRSRILVAASYDKYLNAATGMIAPSPSDHGAWVMMQNQTNRRRISRDGTRFYPAQVGTTCRLRFGSLDPKEASYDSLADFYFCKSEVELRIPWSLINVTDPSSRTVLWKEKDRTTKKTDGVRVIVVSYKPEQGGLAACETGEKSNHTDRFPPDWKGDGVSTFSWQGWNTPVYHTYLKQSYHHYRRILAEIPEMP